MPPNTSIYLDTKCWLPSAQEHIKITTTRALASMDIARSINFESLSEDNDALSTSPKQTYGIDVNRQFDLYTTESMHLPTEAPPIYQKDQPLDGFSHAMPPAPHKPWLSKSPSAPQFVLKTIPHAPTATASGEAKLARQSDEVRQSLQLPRTEAASNSSHFLRNEAINDAPVRHTSPDKNTVLCEVSVETNSYVPHR